MEQVHPVRAYCLDSGKKLSDLALEVKTSKATLSRIVNWHQPVSLDLLPELVRVTGIPAKELRPDVAEKFESAGASQ